MSDPGLHEAQARRYERPTLSPGPALASVTGAPVATSPGVVLGGDVSGSAGTA
jgi:hypothetical protein